MSLVLDKATHTYSVNGIILPSVTQILKAAGFYNYGQVNKEILERAAKFGSAVHKACALDDMDNLGEHDPLLDPYLDGWRNFRKSNKHQVEFRIIEKPLHSEIYRFAGTPDRLGILNKTTGLIVDIKTGQHETWHELQSAGYELLFREHLGNRAPRIWAHWIVYLNPQLDMGFKVEPVDRREIELNKRTFLAALQVYSWRAKQKGAHHDTN